MRRFALIVLVNFLLLSGGIALGGVDRTYVTWTGIGPDKWASAWLIHQHLDPGAVIRIVPTNTEPGSDIPFDIPGKPPYLRDASQTTYGSLLAGFRVEDATLEAVGAIIYDIEVNFWGGEQVPGSTLVETAFRSLQMTYGRESVPQSCYFQLFDKLYHHLKKPGDAVDLVALQQAVAHDRACGSVHEMTVLSDRKYVAEWRPQHLLSFLSAGDKVVFIDTRESDEFEEGHIPGAVNIRLRDIGDKVPPALANADVVVPYCVKDFRAFEVAKRLKLLGVEKVGLMNPWGISGWKASGLPVAGKRGLPAEAAQRQLDRCVEKPAVCLDHV